MSFSYVWGGFFLYLNLNSSGYGLSAFLIVPGTVWQLFNSSLSHANTYGEDFIKYVKFSMKVILTDRNFWNSAYLFMKDIQSRSYDIKQRRAFEGNKVIFMENLME